MLSRIYPVLLPWWAHDMLGFVIIMTRIAPRTINAFFNAFEFASKTVILITGLSPYNLVGPCVVLPAT